MKAEHRTFYREVLENIQSNTLAIFAGAGLSKSAGYVDWKGLLKDIAEDLELDIDIEQDLISIAQYNQNKYSGKSMLNQKIITEFNQDANITDAHRVLARLPIYTYWTTNYDDLIEKSLQETKRVADVKHNISQLSLSIPRRDAVVYKMHGDSTLPNDAVLTKDDYERYPIDNAPFISALSGDLVSKLFVFIGFSFTDPNLDYILSRVRLQMRGSNRHHYYFIKKVTESDSGINNRAELEYQKRKQELFVEDLKRHKLLPVYVETYTEITEILSELEKLYKKGTVFISGSAEEYGKWGRHNAQSFIHNLSKKIIEGNYKIVNGFGWGIGSAIINGSLEQIYSNPNRYNENQLIVKPFPQFPTGSKDLKTLWHEYRQNLLEYSGIAIFVFGNKNKDGKVISADGVKKEFDIAVQNGIKVIPVGATGYMAKELWELVMADFEFYYPNSNDTPLLDLFKLIGNEAEDENNIINNIIYIINYLKTQQHG